MRLVVGGSCSECDVSFQGCMVPPRGPEAQRVLGHVSRLALMALMAPAMPFRAKYLLDAHVALPYSLSHLCHDRPERTR